MKIITTCILLIVIQFSFGQISMRLPQTLAHNLQVQNYSEVNSHWQKNAEKIKNAEIKTATKTTSRLPDTIITLYNRNGTIHSINGHTPYSFDSLNRLINLDSRYYLSNDSIVDTAGFIVEIDYSDLEIHTRWKTYNTGGSQILFSEIIYKYNENGLLILDSSYAKANSSEGSNKILTHHYSYQMDNMNRVKSMTLIDPQLFRPLTFNYYYENDRRIIRYRLGTSERFFVEMEINDEIATYDSLGNTWKIEYHHYNSEMNRKQRQDSYSYVIFDEFGNMVETLTHRGKKLFVEFEYDQHGNILSEKRYKKILGIFKKHRSTTNYSYTYY